MAHRKHQGDIDVDAIGDQLFDGGNARRRRRHFDHQIGPVDRGSQTLRFADRFLGVVGEMRRHFETDVAVVAVRRIIDRAQHVRRHLNIFDGQRFVKFFDRNLTILL